MIMQLKRKKKQKKIDSDSFKLLIYMYGLRYLQFNQKVLPQLDVSNPGAHAESFGALGLRETSWAFDQCHTS